MIEDLPSWAKGLVTAMLLILPGGEENNKVVLMDRKLSAWIDLGSLEAIRSMEALLFSAAPSLPALAFLSQAGVSPFFLTRFLDLSARVFPFNRAINLRNSARGSSTEKPPRKREWPR